MTKNRSIGKRHGFFLLFLGCRKNVFFELQTFLQIDYLVASPKTLEQKKFSIKGTHFRDFSFSFWCQIFTLGVFFENTTLEVELSWLFVNFRFFSLKLNPIRCIFFTRSVERLCQLRHRIWLLLRNTFIPIFIPNERILLVEVSLSTSNVFGQLQWNRFETKNGPL